jgi:hypothetical protein
MIHPQTELKLINKEMGYGVFATTFIPKGTILYAKDPLEIEVSPAQYESMETGLKEIVYKYAYIDERGMRIVSWDFARYVNHRCECNSMTTGYGFEIAIKDIEPGEEITDEYGLLNIEEAMPLACTCQHCRHVVTPQDIDLYYPTWDAKIKEALSCLGQVEQPLLKYLDSQTEAELRGYLIGEAEYRSVINLKYGLPVAV